MKIFAYTIVLLLAFAVAPVDAGHHRQFKAEVSAISDDHGNIDTNAGAEAIAELQLQKGKSFPVGFGDKEFKVYFGDTYSDVPRGDWVAFVTEGGTLRIARNFEDAAATLGVKVGDTITLFN